MIIFDKRYAGSTILYMESNSPFPIGIDAELEMTAYELIKKEQGVDIKAESPAATLARARKLLATTASRTRSSMARATGMPANGVNAVA
jgi:hypothetical protein